MKRQKEGSFIVGRFLMRYCTVYISHGFTHCPGRHNFSTFDGFPTSNILKVRHKIKWFCRFKKIYFWAVSFYCRTLDAPLKIKAIIIWRASLHPLTLETSTGLRMLTSFHWIESFWKYLSNVNINPCSAQVFFIRFPFLSLNVISQRCRFEMRRKRTFQDTRYGVVCASTSRSWHDCDVSRSQKDRNGLCIPCQSTNQEDGGVA